MHKNFYCQIRGIRIKGKLYQAGGFGQGDFRYGAAVKAKAQRFHDAKYPWVRQGLDRVVFTKTLNPGKDLLEVVASLLDTSFIIDMKRRSEMCGNII